jgi:hypothetical protein
VGLIASALALFLIENEEFRIVANALRRLIRKEDVQPVVLAPSAEETS